MNFYTSYYGNRRLYRTKQFLVQISNSKPKGFQVDFRLDEAVPDWNTIVSPYKDGELIETDYIIRYRKQLDVTQFAILLAIDAIKEQADGKDIVFLCYEKPGVFCHRHIFAQWMSERHEEYRIAMREIADKEEIPSLFD